MELLKKDLYKMRYAIVLIIIFFTFMQIKYGTVCYFYALTKFRCPACGLTRATISLLKGNWKAAFSYNPTVLLWLSTIGLFAVDRYFHKLKFKVFPYFFILVGLITIIWYVFSLI